ncbi:dihydroorotate dehydrogenase [Bacillus sp. AK128]
MPDWSYHTVFKPLLNSIHPATSRELIHRSMNMISALPFGEKFIEFLGHMKTPSTSKKELFNTSFPSSVGLSGRIDPQLTGINAFQHLGFGFIEIGPITIEGNKEGQITKNDNQINQSSSISIGLEEAKKKLSLIKKKRLPFLCRLDGSFHDIQTLINTFFTQADGFIINYRPELTDVTLSELQKKLGGKGVIVSFKHDELSDLLNHDHSILSSIDGIMLEDPQLKQGEELKSAHLKLIHHMNMLGIQVPILTVGGVKEPKDALDLLDEGASLILLGFEYIFTGPGLPKRINEALQHRDSNQQLEIKGWIWYWLFGLCILLAGFLTLLFSMTKVVLPYDELFLQMVRGEIVEYNPLILNFMAHDRMTLAGTMISGGFLYMQLAKHGIRRGLHWTKKAVNIGGIIGFLGILLFIGYGYFDWLHALFWVILLPLFILGHYKTKEATLTPSGINLRNHISWKVSLIGQLSFVILGFSLTIGGIVISIIGTTSVFVSTDLTYLCMSVEQLNEFNSRLIPVIAHDRAGFGSALLSVGLLVLMLSLWGIREGERWVLWTLTVGAVPAFLAGILTHFFIGYLDFIHLFPAYLALAFYFIGIVFLAPYLLKTKK